MANSALQPMSDILVWTSHDLIGDEYAFNLSVSYNSEAWLLTAGYREVGDNFNPEVGFLRRSGYRNPSAGIFHRYRPKNFIGLLEVRPHINYRGFWNFDGFQETGFLHMDNHWEWRNGYEVHTGVNVTREGISTKDDSVTIQDVFIPPGTYDHAEFQLSANTNQGAWWSFRTRVTIGGYFGGDRIAVSPSIRVRIGDTFNTQFSLNHNNVDLPQGSFVTNLFRARFSYSFTPRIFLQTLIQYNNSDDIWSTNLRFGWLQTANTGLFVVYRDTRAEESGSFDTQFRSFVVKYSHLLDLLN